MKLLRKKVLIPGLVILILVGFFIYRTQVNKQAKLQFAQVKKQDIRSIVSSSGSLTGEKQANLKFKSAGKLAYLNVKAGDTVSAADVIAGLDTQQLSIDLQQAQNTLRDKQAAVEKTLDDVKGHDKDETFAQKKDRTTAEVARDNAYDAVRAAQRAFQDAVIISPISGLVTQASPVAGQTVSTSDLIAQVVDTSQIYFDTDVDEADIGQVKLGQGAEVSLDAYPNKTFKGTVNQILPQTKTTSSGATVVTVRIKIINPPTPFVNGLSGQSAIIVSEVKNVLTIPQEALRDDNTVVEQINNQLTVKKVTAGIKSDTDVEIKEGLNENESVVLNPPTQVK